jgi:hypothetical protein
MISVEKEISVDWKRRIVLLASIKLFKSRTPYTFNDFKKAFSRLNL